MGTNSRVCLIQERAKISSSSLGIALVLLLAREDFDAGVRWAISPRLEVEAISVWLGPDVARGPVNALFPILEDVMAILLVDSEIEIWGKRHLSVECLQWPR